MRPLCLSLTAFGPFAGTEVVDFSALDGQLLLIEGPTGAGKTTLLDGICYALYGTVPGPRLEAVAQLRSHHARGAEACRAELTFALGPRTFRVEREPTQTRPRRRGEGQAEARAQARLCELTSEGEKPLCAPKVTLVDEAIRQLLGLDADQFMQVLLLPQGEFRRFLLSRSDEKERLLEKLFGTLLYRDAAEHLALRRSELQTRAHEAQDLRDEALAAVGATGLPELDARVLDLEKNVLVLEASAVRARASMQGALAARDAAEKAAQALDRRDTLRRAWASMLSERPAVQAAKERLQRSARASALAGILEREAEAARASREAGLDRARRQEAQEALARELVVRREAATQVPQLAARAEALAVQEAGFQRLSFEEARERELASALARAQREVDAAREARGAVARERESRAAGREARAQELGALQQRAARLGELELLAAQAQKTVERRRSLQGAQATLARARSEHAEALAAGAGAREVERARQQTLAEARRAREEGVAAELAGALVPGERCPVCGSSEHPAPALAAQAPPSRAALVALEKGLAAARAITEQADRRIAATAEDIAGAQARVLGETAELGPLAGEALDDLMSRAAFAAAEAAAASSAAAEAARRAEAIAALDGLLLELAARLAAAADRVGVAEGEAEGLRVVHGEVQRSLAAQLPGGGKAADLAALARQQLEEARSQASALQEALTRSESEEAVARAALDAAMESGRRAGQSAARAAEELVRAAAAAGFSSGQEAQGAVLADDAAAELEERLRDFAGREASTSDRLQEAERAATGASAVDRAAATAAAEAAHQAAFDAERLHAEAGKDLEASRAALERARGHESAFAAAAADLRVVGSLSALLRGDNPLRLTLQRFVLASRMDEVAVAASGRLLHMSRGRYLLRRTDEVRHGGRASGLDLVVEDRATGTERSVHTLSGGEMFLASLALALGLSDVVTRRSGGVRLDALFIDEGFGMLDDESLDLVLGTLESLQAGGRLVGLISHLAELKERIPVRLTVHKGPKGSHTEIRSAVA